MRLANKTSVLLYKIRHFVALKSTRRQRQLTSDVRHVTHPVGGGTGLGVESVSFVWTGHSWRACPFRVPRSTLKNAGVVAGGVVLVPAEQSCNGGEGVQYEQGF